VKAIATIVFSLLVLAAYPVCGQHVLQIKPHAPADAPVIAKYRYQRQQPDSLAALQEAHLLLQQLYADGYLIARFSNLHQGSDSTLVSVATGEPYSWLSLNKGNVEERLLQEAGYRERFYRQKPFSYKQVARLMQRLVQLSENKGYPFALLRLDSLQINKNSIAAALYYEPGPFITFDSLQIQGEVRIKQRFLAAHLGIMPGAPFNQQRIEEAFQHLEELPYIRLTEAPALSFQNRQARLLLNLRRQPANRIDGILGMQSKPAGGILLTGQLDLFLQNPFGGGKTIAVNWQRLNEESQQLDLAYRHPYLLNSPVTLVLEGNLLKEQEQFLNRNARVALQARQKAGIMLSLEYQFKDTRLLDDARGADLASFRIHKYGVRGEYKKLDNHLLPRQGVVLGAEVLAGPKHISRMADGSTHNLGTNLQMNAALDAQIYWSLAARTVLALQGTAALLFDENLFLPDLYRLGGLQSIRGFREKSLFASKYALLQTEIRQQLGNSSYVFLFYDLGLLQYKLPVTSYRDWPMGAGAGLSLQASTGQFSLVYALGHQQNQTISLKNSQVHFGYTSRF
jgi:outer membrane protein assembly factor BamA